MKEESEVVSIRSNGSQPLPTPDFPLTPTSGQQGATYTSIPSFASQTSYQPLATDEDRDGLPHHVSDEAPTATSDKEKKPLFLVGGWPSKPRSLYEWTWKRYLILGFDIIFTLIPVLFLVLGISALALDQKPLSPFGDRILAAIKIGPTTFPIIFAAIVTRLLRGIAQWKVERGTQLGLLEQLIGSQNLAGAIKHMVKSSSVDLWNNVKIPMITELSPWREETSGNPWITINQTDEDPVYSSLTGLNINGLPTKGESLFTIETSYLQPTCEDGRITKYDRRYGYSHAFPDGLQWHNTLDPFGAMSPLSNGNRTSSCFFDSNYARGFFTNTTVPLNLLYGSRRTNGIMTHNCTVATARIEAAISCQGELCKVDNVRRSTVDRRSPFIVPFHDSGFVNFCLFMPFMSGTLVSSPGTPVESYLDGSDLPYSSRRSYFTNVTGDVFASRLGTLMNTLRHASLGGLALPLGAEAKWVDLQSHTGMKSNEAPITFQASTTTARVKNPIQTYQAKRLYITLLLSVTGLLQLCAAACLLLKYTTTIPDLLGYVSTQTRDNPYVDMPADASFLSGLERARLLDGVQVQIGDVKRRENEGHVAFGSVSGREDSVFSRVKHGRLYE